MAWQPQGKRGKVVALFVIKKSLPLREGFRVGYLQKSKISLKNRKKKKGNPLPAPPPKKENASAVSFLAWGSASRILLTQKGKCSPQNPRSHYCFALFGFCGDLPREKESGSKVFCHFKLVYLSYQINRLSYLSEDSHFPPPSAEGARGWVDFRLRYFGLESPQYDNLLCWAYFCHIELL